jgi:hypothetical protein
VPPFRWDLVTPDQLGSLLDGVNEPNLWFLDELVVCAGKVLARSGNGRLVFVGRSLDSMFDLLSGAVPDRVARLPISFARREPSLTPEQVNRAREMLTELDLAPAALARRPVTFVDVVHRGSTFGELFTLLDDWIGEVREPWPVIRRHLRFVGVTSRQKTSPNTWRWQQHAEWTSRLPASSVVNVSLPYYMEWHYFGDLQTKLTRSFTPADWLADDDGPNRDERTRQALAEAVALVRYGRSREGRQAVARAVQGEPALREPWLRKLVGDLTTA